MTRDEQIDQTTGILYQRRRFNNFLNTLCLFTTSMVLALAYWTRMDMQEYLTGWNYVTLFSLAATIFILPDFLHRLSPARNVWYRSNEFYTFCLIVVLGAGGILLSSLTPALEIIIIPSGISLGLWQLFQFYRNGSYLGLSAGIVFMVFIVLLFYSQHNHSILFPEKIIIGQAHIDPLFNGSISNMFSTLGFPSTGLDGTPFIHYHFGYHALVAGFKNWTGMNTLLFINIAYPAIFIPLFMKSLLGFSERLFLYKGTTQLNALFAIAFLIFIYSLPLAEFDKASPLPSEGFTIALTLMFLYGSILLSGKSGTLKHPNLFLLFTLITILVISFFKISNGFVCIAGLVYLYLRRIKNSRSHLIVLTGLVMITAFIYFFIFPVDRATYSGSLADRWFNMWDKSDSFITYTIGIILFVLLILKNHTLKNWNELLLIFKSGKHIELEVIFIITLSGLIGGIYASSNKTDVYYFCSVQFFITIPFIIYYCQQHYDKFMTSKSIKHGFLILIILLTVISSPQIIKNYTGDIATVRLKANRLSPQQRTLGSCTAELFALDRSPEKHKTCLYFPRSEKWYYESQNFRPLGSPLVAPAISGIALVGGVSDSILNSGFNYYSYYYYRQPGYKQPENIGEAKIIAKRLGYDRLIEFRGIGEKAVTNVYDLISDN